MENKKDFKSRALAVLLAMAMCVSMLPVSVLADELEGEEESAPEVEVEIVVTEDKTTGDVDVEVTGRPEVAPGEETEESKEYDVTDPDTGVNVSGSVNGTIDEDAGMTDGRGRPTHVEGTIEGEETIDVPEHEMDPDFEPETTAGIADVDPDKVDADKIDFTFDGKGPDAAAKTEDLDADLDDVVSKNKPTEPADDALNNGWEVDEEGKYTKQDEPVIDEATGVKTTVKTEWDVQDVEDGKGWISTKVETTTEEGVITPAELEELGWWSAPTDEEGAALELKTAEDGSQYYEIVERGTPDADGTRIDTTIKYDPATGRYTKITRRTTVETVTYEQESSGKVTIFGVTIDVGDKDGLVSGLVTLGPQELMGNKSDAQLKAVKRDDMITKFNNGEAGLYDLARWSRLNPTKEPLVQVLLTAATDRDLSVGTGEIYLINYGIQSTVGLDFAVNAENDPSRSIWFRKFVTKDANGAEVELWVYCSQKGTPAPIGSQYEIVNVMDTVGTLYSEDQAKHIQYIVEHGYWGVGTGASTGAGTLAAVKDLVPAANKADLNAGLAMAATQAAIWYYAHSEKWENDGDFYTGDIFDDCWKQGNGNAPSGSDSATRPLTTAERAAAMALFEALIAPSAADLAAAGNVTDIISKEDIKGASIDVNGKVSQEELEQMIRDLAGSADQKSTTSKRDPGYLESLKGRDDLYKTDLSLTVAVIPSQMGSSDMKVVVLVDGKEAAEVPLTSTTQSSDGTVTIEIPDMVLPSGVNVTLNLNGTQELTEGAYLFRSDLDYSGSQTMVSYVSGAAQRIVDLNVDMTFSVTDPSVKETTAVTATQTVQQTSSWNWSQTWEQDYTYRPDPAPDPDPTPSSSQEEEEDEEELTDSEIPLADMPEEELELELELADPEIPLAEEPEEEIELDDPEIPLADVPATGDISLAWYAAAMLSACGLAAMLLGKERKDQES